MKQTCCGQPDKSAPGDDDLQVPKRQGADKRAIFSSQRASVAHVLGRVELCPTWPSVCPRSFGGWRAADAELVAYFHKLSLGENRFEEFGAVDGPSRFVLERGSYSSALRIDYIRCVAPGETAIEAEG